MDPVEKAKQSFFEALALQSRGDFPGARRLYEQALSAAPDRPSIMNNLAVACLQTGDPVRARELCERCLRLDANDLQARMHLGIALVRLSSAAAALEAFDTVLEARPEDPHAAANRGIALLQLKRPQAALSSCDRALAVKADFPEALCVRANALLALDREEDAVASLRSALRIQPDHAEAHANLAGTLLRLGRVEEANAAFHAAIESRPADMRCRVQFGDALRIQFAWDEAVEQFEAVLQQAPRNADAAYGLACVRLMQRDFARGWPAYERRLDTEEFRDRSFRNNRTSVVLFEQHPRWQGPQSPQSGTMALWAEQGIGDEVLFSTLLPELKAARVDFVYELDARLRGLYERAFPDIRFVARKDPPERVLTEAESVLAIGSLPGLFRRSAADFARQPQKLISALPARVAHYRGQLGEHGQRLNVAISWQSGRDHWWSKRKDAPLDAFAALARLPGVQLVDVQYGDTDAARTAFERKLRVPVIRFASLDFTNDIEGVCAVLEACDLVVTTSNATAHFAGALGRPTWLMYPADRPLYHYWTHGGDRRCAWYPSVEILTAPELGNWEAVLARAASRLESA